MIIGIILIIIFLIMMVLMYLNKISALLALPIMAILFAIIGSVPLLFVGSSYQGVVPDTITPAETQSLTFSLYSEYSGGTALWSETQQVKVANKSYSIILGNIKIIPRRLFDGQPYYLGVQFGKSPELVDRQSIILSSYGSQIWTKLTTSGFVKSFSFIRDLASNNDLLKIVIGEGSLRLHEAYTLALFGGMLAIFVRKKGIAEAIIRIAAELAGDKPIIVAIVMMLVTAGLFITLGGLGAIIMVGSIIFPIMLSLGTPPLVAAGVMLIGVCAGGSLSPASWVFYENTLGVSTDITRAFAIKIAGLYILIGLVFIMLGLRKKNRVHYWAVEMQPEEPAKGKVGFLAILTPVIPIILVLIFKTPFFAAFIAGLIWGLLTTWEKGAIKSFTKAMFEGAESVLPAVLLMIGIGMLLKSVTLDTVKGYLQPLLSTIIPSTKLGYLVVFTIFAPLALYRGPLNVWGMGSGLAGIMLATGTLPPPAIMGLFLSVGAIQGVCDPTNTHNVWISSYLGVEVISITKKLIPYIWVLAALGLIISAISYL
ncbi:MAG: citrate transporter [bacterium]|nr:citrate transporter [bacterium]